jgi:hypothetical protein
MPLVDAVQVEPALLNPLGSSPLPDDEEQKAGVSPGIAETLGAAFRTENTLGSAAVRAYDSAGVHNQLEPGYSAWDDIKGTPYEDHWQNFVESNNRGYSDFIKREIDRETADRRTLAAAGGGGIAASLLAGVVDPTILIPVGGEIALAGKGVWRFGRGAMVGARAAAVGTAAQEGVLQATQELRTPEESAMAIGSSIVLGGLVGGSVAGLMSRPEQLAAESALERIHTDAMNAQPAPASAGAAAVKPITTEDLTVAGRVANKVASTTRMISPNLRANFRAAPSARQFSQELAENTLYQGMHGEGRTLGAAVETEARSIYNARMFDAVSAHNDIFSEMKKTPGIDMSRADFEEAIGKALRRGDVGENDFVSRAAKAWRERVFDPWKNEAIDAGLLPPDVSVTTADSYFSRMYSRERMNAQEPDFKAKVAAFYEGKIADDYAEGVRTFQERQQALDQEAADLRMAPEDRVKTLHSLEQEGDKLDLANADAVDQVSRINELRQVAQAASNSGDVIAEKAARDEIAAIRAKGGTRLADYLKARGKLRSRHRKVDLNYEGMRARADAIQDSLLSLQEANVKGISRLVSRGRTLEKEAQRLDPEKLQSKLADLRSSFYSIVTRSEKAAERLGRSLDKLGVDDPKAAARIEKARMAEVNRNLELNSIARRLEAAEALDPHAGLAEIKASIDDLVRQVSDVTLARGEKAQRLQARLARLDPKQLDARVTEIAALKAKIERDFYDRWEIKRLGEGVDPHAPGVRPDFKVHANDIANDVFDKITGRGATSSESATPEYMTPLARGPMKDRTFNVPDLLIEDYLEHNVRSVAERYGRAMAADTELTKRFGRADMRDQIASIRDEYRTLREAPGLSEKDLKALGDDETGAIRDLEAMRDLIRGTYKANENSSNYGRLVRSLMAFNYLRVMGGVVIANIGEVMRPAMVHGLGRFMSEGVAPLVNNMGAIKLSVKEAQLSGQVVERVLQHRMMSLGEIGDPYRSGTAIERWLTNLTRTASKWNGLVYWTDGMKAVSSVLSQNRIIEGALKGKDARTLAYLGIDGDMAQRIAKEFTAHGETMDNVRVANTEKWTDEQAVRAYRSAVSKDVDSIIVTKSVGDVPLFANTATGKLILQFRNYTFAAHQRLLLRGLQEGQTQFLSGMIGMASLGMLGAALRSWRGGADRFEKFKEAASNPGYLIGEGIDLSGVATIPVEIGNTTEKVTSQAFGTGFNPVKTPLLYAGKLVSPDASMQGSSTRFASRGMAGAVLGPSFGMVFDTSPRALGATKGVLGGEPTESQVSAATAMIPFNSYAGVKETLQLATGDSPYVEKRN